MVGVVVVVVVDVVSVVVGVVVVVVGVVVVVVVVVEVATGCVGVVAITANKVKWLTCTVMVWFTVSTTPPGIVTHWPVAVSKNARTRLPSGTSAGVLAVL